jgi:hypothetical protein
MSSSPSGWFHLSIPMMGRKSQEHSTVLNALQEPHYIHDETIDASPFHDSDDDVSIIPDTKEFF